MKTVKRLLTNLLILTGAVLVALCVAEAATRLILPAEVRLRLMHQADEKLGFRLVPNYQVQYELSGSSAWIRTNSEGLRDREYPKEKGPNTFRIVAVGDSFTFGLGVDVEESYPKILEALLNRAAAGVNSKRFEVINAGVAGYGTVQEYLYLGELLPRYRPDLVIVGLYANDIQDVMVGLPSEYARSRLRSRFYILSYLRSLQILASRLFVGEKDIRKDLLEIYQDTHPPEFEKALERTKEYLADIRDVSQAMGAETLILIIPTCFEVDLSEREPRGLKGMYSDEFFHHHMDRFSRTFSEFGNARGIATLPLLPVFRKSTIRPLYLARDPHWNRAGHTVAAEAIADYLREQGVR